MAYSARNWNDGELVQAADMNRIERGIEDVGDDVSGMVDDVDGLAARLAALEYRSGIRDVASLADEGWTDVLAKVWRAGTGVNISVDRAGRAQQSSSTETLFTLPSGYRPPATIVVRSGRGMVARILTSGAVQIIAPGVSVDYFSITFDTLQPPAISEPGDPA